MQSLAAIRGLDDIIWSMMEMCWNEDKCQRPSASAIAKTLRVSVSTRHINLSTRGTQNITGTLFSAAIAEGLSVDGELGTRPSATLGGESANTQTNRRMGATFACPVPGCGSTFTRHFNLKGIFVPALRTHLLAVDVCVLGHLRSHDEERPFKCKWPGCERSFARQHDCKRHEALHLNIRPFVCQGCQRTFARMDALNRHCELESINNTTHY